MKRFLILILITMTFVFSQNKTEKKAPDFMLKNLEGQTETLSSYINKGPVLLCFWATWCKPCQEELKEYSKIYKEFNDKGLQMLAVSTDNERSIAKVKPFVKVKNYSFNVLLDPNSNAAKKYYAYNVPHTVIINSEGEIIYSHMGYKKGDEKKVKKIISNLFSSE